MPQNSFSKLFQNKIFLISTAIFSLICVLFGVYFYQNNSLKSANSQNSQNSQNSSSSNSSQISISNSVSNSISNSTNSSFYQTNNQNSNSIVTNFSNSRQKIENSQTYINELFPNFKLNYSKDWKMETKTIPDNLYQDIQTREIVLTKNQSIFIIRLAPIVPTGCTPGKEIPILAELGKFKRYKTIENPYNGKSELNDYYYSKSSYCNLENIIKTNIDSKNIKFKDSEKYVEELISNEDKTIDFILLADLESINPTEITEADEIIKNSVLE